MIVTINTDASFSHNHKRGSFAFWIVSNRFKILKAGIIRKTVLRPEMAEAMCIINALHILCNENLDDVTRIIINTDCLNAVYILRNDKEQIRKYRLKWGLELRDTFNKRYKHIKSKIEFRHVKAHSGVQDARSYVNEWCDRNAKLQLKQHLNLN